MNKDNKKNILRNILIAVTLCLLFYHLYSFISISKQENKIIGEYLHGIREEIHVIDLVEMDVQDLDVKDSYYIHGTYSLVRDKLLININFDLAVLVLLLVSGRYQVKRGLEDV